MKYFIVLSILLVLAYAKKPAGIAGAKPSNPLSGSNQAGSANAKPGGNVAVSGNAKPNTDTDGNQAGFAIGRPIGALAEKLKDLMKKVVKEAVAKSVARSFCRLDKHFDFLIDNACEIINGTETISKPCNNSATCTQGPIRVDSVQNANITLKFCSNFYHQPFFYDLYSNLPIGTCKVQTTDTAATTLFQWNCHPNDTCSVGPTMGTFDAKDAQIYQCNFTQRLKEFYDKINNHFPFNATAAKNESFNDTLVKHKATELCQKIQKAVGAQKPLINCTEAHTWFNWTRGENHTEFCLKPGKARGGDPGSNNGGPGAVRPAAGGPGGVGATLPEPFEPEKTKSARPHPKTGVEPEDNNKPADGNAPANQDP